MFDRMMSSETRHTIRENARIVGALLQGLAVVTFIASFVATYQLAHAGEILGVAPSHDPLPWIVFGVGIIAALLIAGLGYSLAMLCAIYDETLANAAQAAGYPRQLPSVEQEWRSRVAGQPSYLAEDSQRRREQLDATSKSAPVTQPLDTGSRLWAALTKERHLKKPRP